ATSHHLVLVRLDERDYLLCWRSSSAPKKEAARLRISFARRSSRFSCSSAFSRSDSSVLTPGTSPSSISARLTPVRTDSARYACWSASRLTVPSNAPHSSRRVRTILSAAASISPLYPRDVGPATCLLAMTPFSLPSSRGSTEPRTVHI